MNANHLTALPVCVPFYGVESGFRRRTAAITVLNRLIARLGRALIKARASAGVAILFGATAMPYTTNADTVVAGMEYIHSRGAGETFVDFAAIQGFPFPEVGRVDLEGNPINSATLFSTDIIVERLEDAILPDAGSSATVPLKLIALSLKSIDPVTLIGLGDFNLFLNEDPSIPSIGTITLRHEFAFPDDGTNLPEGTFETTIDVNGIFRFEPVGGGPGEFSVPFTVENMATVPPAFWTHSHDGVPSLPDNGNFFMAPFMHPGTGEFFPFGLNHEEAAMGEAVHRGEWVPEPASAFLLALGGAVITKRRR